MSDLQPILDYYGENSHQSPDALARLVAPQQLIDSEKPERHVTVWSMRYEGLGFASWTAGAYISGLVRNQMLNFNDDLSDEQPPFVVQNIDEIVTPLNNRVKADGLLDKKIKTGNISSLAIRACLPSELSPVPKAAKRPGETEDLAQYSTYFQLLGKLTLGRRDLGNFAAGIHVMPVSRLFPPIGSFPSRRYSGLRVGVKRTTKVPGSVETMLKAIQEQSVHREAIARTNTVGGGLPGSKR